MSAATPHAGVRYRPDIDGLRAVAVAAVVLYHAGFTTFGGGYVGVDVFFVISGYLIMSVIAADVAQRRFSLALFYERRARRIFPALFVVALFCLVVALAMFPPARLSGFARSLVAMALFVSNMYFRGIATARGYFDEASESQLLLHTWSLAVEEQFYLLLPALLMLLRPLRPRTTRLVLATLALGSFAWATYTVSYKPNYAFYVVFPRAWELLAGSLLAIAPAPPAPSGRLPREAVALAGVALLLYPIFFFTKDTLFPGPAALPAVAGTVLVIYAGHGNDLSGAPSLAARALSWRPIVFVGLISYSLYLWHWPLIVIVRYLAAGATNANQMRLAVGLSFVLAVLSWRFVERPFRGRGAVLTRRGVFVAGGAAMAAAAFASVVVLATGGLGIRFGEPARAAMAANLERKGENPPNACLNWDKDFHSTADVTLCRINKRADARKVLFWGDSHVAQFRPLVETLFDEGVFGNREIRFATAGGCLPSPLLNHTGGPYRCAAFNRMAQQLVDDPTVDTVLLGFSGWFEKTDPPTVCLVDTADKCSRFLSGSEVAETLAAAIRGVGEALARRHVAFVVMLPMPNYNEYVPDVEINRIALGFVDRALVRLGVIDPLERSDNAYTRSLVAAAAREVGATIFDPREVLCHGGACLYARDEVSIYSDASHVASSQIGMFHDAMAAAFRQVLAGR